MDKKREERVRRLLAEAAGDEHERLKAALSTWAISKGFSTEFGRLASGIPDVLRGTNATPSYLFVGDAKDSTNETADVFATWERIRGYMRDFGTLIANGSIKGGFFAIATNTRKAAERWVPFLNAMAESEELVAAGTANSPDFRVEAVDARTFIVMW